MVSEQAVKGSSVKRSRKHLQPGSAAAFALAAVAVGGLIALGTAINASAEKSAPSVESIALLASPSPTVPGAIAGGVASHDPYQANTLYPASGASAMTSDEALKIVKGFTAIVGTTPSVSVFPSTMERLEALTEKDSGLEQVPSAIDVQRPVWAVVVLGVVKPQYAHGQSYDWGIFVFDQKTSVPIATLAGRGGAPTLP